MATGTIKRTPRPFWGRGFPDPNTHGAFFSFRLRQPATSSSFLPSTRIVFGNQHFQAALSDVIAPRLASPCLTSTRSALRAFLASCLATTSLAFALVVSVDLTDAILFLFTRLSADAIAWEADRLSPSTVIAADFSPSATSLEPKLFQFIRPFPGVTNGGT